MSEKHDPPLWSEEQIIQYVQDHALYKAGTDPHYFVLWDGVGFYAESPAGLVQKVKEFVSFGDAD